jgi:uncharacterized protein YndB with AHSA1/START domain
MSESVIVDCDLAEPPEKVWRALTVPELLAEWLMPNDFAPQVGHDFTFRPEKGADIACEVLDVEENRMIRYSWREEDQPVDSIVTVRLTPLIGGGTHLRLVHTGFPLRASRASLALSRAGRTMATMLQGGLRWAA